MKRFYFTFLLALCLKVQAQLPATPPEVCIYTGDSAYAISYSLTQTEVRPGWKIVDIETKSKKARYLWGKRAKQVTFDRKPRFIIDIQDHELTDFVILKLKEKNTYRKFQKPELVDCPYTRVDLFSFSIKLLEDERYEISPLQNLEPGEYIIARLNAKQENEYGDFKVYPFTVE